MTVKVDQYMGHLWKIWWIKIVYFRGSLHWRLFRIICNQHEGNGVYGGNVKLSAALENL